MSRAVVGLLAGLVLFSAAGAGAQPGLIPGGLTALPGIYAYGPDLAINGGFESNDGVKPSSWVTDAAWRVDSATARSGAWSLRLSDAPNVPFAQIARQSLTLRRGVYKLSGWIKTESLGANTAGSGVRLNLDFSDYDAGMLRRGLTPILSGTRDWTYVEERNIVVPFDLTAVLKLEAYAEPSGTAWFDEVRVEEQLPAPIEVFMLYPNYRGMLFGDQSQSMRFDVAVTPPGGSSGAYQVEATLRAEGPPYEVLRTERWAAQPSFVAAVDGSAMESGRAYLADFRLLDEAGTVLYTFPAYRVSRVPAATRAQMSIAFDDKNRVLMRGVPRFVLGVYDSGSNYGETDSFWEQLLWSPTGDRRMDGLRINAYLNYWYGHAPETAMLSLMSNLERRGVMYLQTGNCFDQRPASALAFRIDVSDAYVETIGGHPASAGYYTVDECDNALIAGADTQYRRLARLDADSMTFGALLGNPPDAFMWADSIDVLSTDPYPLYNTEPPAGYRHGLVAEWTEIARAAVVDARPFMTVLQFFRFTSQGRWPTREEMRAHAYMAIVQGAKGLWWWSLGVNALRDVCSGWCDEKTQHMNDLKAVVAELADLEPVLLADDTPAALDASSNPSAIRTKVKTLDGRVYILAYNATGSPVDVTFTLARPAAGVSVYGESRTVTTSGASFADAFGPYQAHVYVAEPAASLVVDLVAPADGAIVSGAVTVRAQVSGGTPRTYGFSAGGAPFASGPAATVTWETWWRPNGAYQLAVTVEDTEGRTASATANVTVDNRSPVAPQGLRATAISSAAIRLGWSEAAVDEAGFKIEQSADGKTFTEIASVGANQTSYIASGLAASSKYSYRVRAFNGGGASVYSNIAAAKTLKR